MGEMGLRANATPFVGMSNETFDAVMLKPSDNKIRRRDASASAAVIGYLRNAKLHPLC